MDDSGDVESTRGEEGLRVLWDVLHDAGAGPDAVASAVVGRAFAILTESGAATARAFDLGMHLALHELDREVLYRQPVRDRGESPDVPPIPLSDDTFLYARCAVLTSGQEVFDAVLSDPSRFGTTWDLDAEGLLELADAVLDELGADPDPPPDLPSYETGSNAAHWSTTTPGAEPPRPVPPIEVMWGGGWGQHPALIVDAARLRPIAGALSMDLGRSGDVLDRWRLDRGLVGLAVTLSVPLDWYDRGADRTFVHDGVLLTTVHLDQSDLDLDDAALTAVAARRVTEELSAVAKRRRWPKIDWSLSG